MLKCVGFIGEIRSNTDVCVHLDVAVVSALAVELATWCHAAAWRGTALRCATIRRYGIAPSCGGAALRLASPRRDNVRCHYEAEQA